MELEQALVLAMSNITADKPVPVTVSKVLVAKVCSYRARSKWLEDLLASTLTDYYEVSLKTERLLESVQGTFASEDDIFLQAYTTCSDQKAMTDVKRTLAIIPGGKGTSKCE